jgi:hypothetical protein
MGKPVLKLWVRHDSSAYPYLSEDITYTVLFKGLFPKITEVLTSLEPSVRKHPYVLLSPFERSLLCIRKLIYLTGT